MYILQLQEFGCRLLVDISSTLFKPLRAMSLSWILNFKKRLPSILLRFPTEKAAFELCKNKRTKSKLGGQIYIFLCLCKGNSKLVLSAWSLFESDLFLLHFTYQSINQSINQSFLSNFIFIFTPIQNYFVSSGGIVMRALASHQCGPDSIPRLCVTCGLSLLVPYSALRGFSPDPLIFLSPQKPRFDLCLFQFTVSQLISAPLTLGRFDTSIKFLSFPLYTSFHSDYLLCKENTRGKQWQQRKTLITNTVSLTVMV